MGIIVGLAVFSIIVFLHELGHFLAAKSLGVPAPYFSVGMGPVLLSKQWHGTTYQLSAIPMGGYVVFGDIENPNAVSPGKRVLIFLAGPMANFLTAILIYMDLARFMSELWSMLGLVGMLFTHTDQLSGPVGIINFIGAKGESISAVLGIIAMLSMSLGILNLLPFPILDGGQILIALIEIAIRRPLNLKFRIAMAVVCWTILLAFMLYVTAYDVGILERPRKVKAEAAASINSFSSHIT